MYKPLGILMRDKLLRALGPTGRTRGVAKARSKIIIMHILLLFGEHKTMHATMHSFAIYEKH